MSDRYKGAILSPTAPTVTPQSAGGIYTTSQQFQYQGQGVWPTAVNYPINNSLRFRSSASAYLNRTPASAGNRKTWTWSAWVKRGTFPTYSTLFSGGATSSDTGWTGIYFAANGLTIGGSSTNWRSTSQVFRDPSAWYHIVVALDTTQATANNRVKLYVNGLEVTAFSVTNNPTQNADLGINQAAIHKIADQSISLGLDYFDGYMAEINFIDGQALTPSSFGTTDAYGVWQPIPYTGTYGTNGFYLKFTDNSALTTSSNVGLGKDFSGNGNYWVTNNISITSGSTYDSMTDVPTLTSATTANYCVLNPLTTTAGTYSNANLRYLGASAWRRTNSTLAVSTGKWYWEVSIANAPFTPRGSTTAYNSFGFGLSTVFNSTTSASGVTDAVILGDNAYFKNFSGSWTDSGFTFVSGDVLAVAVDLDANTFTFYRNNSQVTTGTIGGTAGRELNPIILSYNGDYGILDANFGQRPFSYTPPTGFNRLNTYNLPTPTILAGNQYMDATTYTGNGGTQSITSLGFQPDLVWVKRRNAVASHNLVDAVRGASKIIYSDATTAEITDTNDINAFNSNGWTMGLNTDVNASGGTYVGWTWRGANGTVSNTQGTITSTVSANTTAGFSIVTWTGTGVNNATVGHGLSVTPAMIIVKSRTQTYNWDIYHQSLGITATLTFTTSATRNVNAFGTNNPTSSVFSVYTNYTNDSGANYVAYCFSAVSGYSAFGSYTGNGSSDGPFVFTGFRPRYVLVKSSSTGGAGYYWTITDTSRNTSNLANLTLNPDTSNAEDNSYGMDILSNGFKIRNTYGTFNGSGVTYIYMAFAENPFKISRAR